MNEKAVMLLAVLGFLTSLGLFMTLIEKVCKSVIKFAYGVRSTASVDAIPQAQNEIKEQVKAFRSVSDEPFINKPENKVTEPVGDLSVAPKSMVEETTQVMLDISGFDDKVTVRVGKQAIVTARYYKGEQVVVRHMNILDERIRARLGKRMQLPPLKINDDWLHAKVQVIRTTREDVKTLFKDYINGQQNIARTKPVESSVEVESSPKEVAVKPAVQTTDVPDSIPQSVDKTAREKAKAIMKGVLQSYGLAERVQGDKTFNHYKVDFIDSETSLLETVWGEDLKRALNSCNAKKGDLIEIFQLGRKPVGGASAGEKKSFMNKFHIVVLNSKSKQLAQ